MISSKRIKQKIISKYINFNSTKMTNLKKLIEKSKMGDGDWILSNDMCEFSNNKLIQLGSIGYGFYRKKEFKYISDDKFDELNCSEISNGDLLINRFITNNTMTCCIVSINEKRLLTSVDVCWIKEDKSKYLNKYLMYCFLSEEFQKKVLSLSSGTTRIRISKSNLSKIDFPILPLEEQEKIVKKIEELFELIDKKEKNDKEKDKLRTLLKEKILDSAIRGELIENDLTFPASDVEEVKEDVPFDIPNNWKWSMFKDVFNIVNGFTPLRTNDDFWNSNDIPWFTVDDIKSQGHIINKTNQFITKKALGKNVNRLIPKNTVLLCCTSATIGNYALTNIELTTNQQWNALILNDRMNKQIVVKYIYYYVQTLRKKMLIDGNSTTFPFISLKKLGNYLIPIPPLEQQKKIVEKIEDCFKLIEQL